MEMKLRPTWIGISMRAILPLTLFAVAAMAHAQNGFSTVAQAINPATKSSTDMGPLDPKTVLHLVVALQPGNLAALQAYADSVSDPDSANYGHFLTPKQNGQFFGQSDASVAQVVAYLKSKGMTVKMVSDNHLAITVDATAAQAQLAFNTKLEKYHAGVPKPYTRQDFYTYAKPVQVPTALSSQIQNVANLTNYYIPKPKILDPTQTRALYDVAPLYANSNYKGQGRTLAIGNYDGYRLTNVPLFYTAYSLPVPAAGVGTNITVVTLNGGSGSGTPGGEGDLDIQMVLSQAPLCNFVIYDSTDFISTLTAVAQDNSVDVINESYGFGGTDADYTTAHNLHLVLTTQGITYVLPSGDYGTDSLTSDTDTYPDYDPEALNVGGTVAVVTPSNTRSSEVGWDGSAGGWDPSAALSFNVLPSYQKGPGVPTTIPYRLVPDIALNASGPGGTGAYYFFLDGTLNNGYQGTSFAGPVFTGQLGDAQQALIKKGAIKQVNGHYRLGRLNDMLYKFGAQANRASIFFDVTSGSNGQLPDGTTSQAGPNWDFVTGLGAPDIAGFVNAFTTLTPTTKYAPLSIGVYSSQGTSPSGTSSSVSSADGVYYSLKSVSSSIGQVSAPLFTYALPTTGTINSLVITASTIVPKSATNFIYMFNYSSGLYDLINTSAGTGSTVTQAISVPNYANYISSTGSVVVVDRALYPTRLGNISFNFKVDQMTLGTN